LWAGFKSAKLTTIHIWIKKIMNSFLWRGLSYLFVFWAASYLFRNVSKRFKVKTEINYEYISSPSHELGNYAVHGRSIDVLSSIEIQFRSSDPSSSQLLLLTHSWQSWNESYFQTSQCNAGSICTSVSTHMISVQKGLLSVVFMFKPELLELFAQLIF